jgi:hypothetical protein
MQRSPRVAHVEVDEHAAEMAAVEAGAKPKDCKSGGRHEYHDYRKSKCWRCGKHNPRFPKFWGPEDAVRYALDKGKPRWMSANAICKEGGDQHTPNGTYVAALRLAALGEIRARQEAPGRALTFRRKGR